MKVSQIRRVLTSYAHLRAQAGDDSGGEALMRLADALAPADSKSVAAAVGAIELRLAATK